MSRAFRMVPPDWQHPTEWGTDFKSNRPELRFRPLFDGNFTERLATWREEKEQWDAGFKRDWPTKGWKPKGADDLDYTYEQWSGECPQECDYMPTFPVGTATHLMMYETVSEGTPISPAFATPEELAHWLADNNASAFAGEGATYEQWLRVCQGGYAPTAIIANGKITSGVAGLHDE